MNETNQILDRQHQRRLYWWGLLVYFALFSFHALATTTLAALVGAKWDALTGQEKFLIVVAVAANWTGMVVVWLQRSLGRLLAGKGPIETGDTERIGKV